MTNNDAIEILNTLIRTPARGSAKTILTTTYNAAILKGIDALKNQSTTEEPVGKWIFDDDGFDEYYGPWYKCPKCDQHTAGCDADKFCPHCGARLEE